MTWKKSWLLALLIPGAGAGCVNVSDVVLLDNKTALEQQAAGEFRALENDLAQAGISPKAEDIPRSQLEAENADLGSSSMGEIVRIYSSVQTDAEWIDDMLVAGCIGEALDGLLKPTPDLCNQDVDAGKMARVVGRTNLHRRQIWRVIRERQPKVPAEEVRSAWRTIHLRRVVCRGLIQTDGQKWEKKRC